MKIFLTASSDTYITNKIIDANTRVHDANVGRAAVLDLFKLYDETNLPADEKKSGTMGDFNLDTDGDLEPDTAIELSRILIKFNLGKINELTGSKLNLNSSNFSAKLKLFDIRTGHAVPSNFTVMAIPLSQAFDEGTGRDLSSFNDIDAANFQTASYSAGADNKWYASGANSSGTLGATSVDLVDAADFKDGAGTRLLVYSQLFDQGDEDFSVDVTPFVSASIAGIIKNHGFRISFTGSHETDKKTRFIKRFASRHVSNPLLRPRIECSFDDSIQDHHENFFFDMSGSLFLNSFDRNGPANLLSGTAGTVAKISGNNCLKLKLVHKDFTETIFASQHKAGTIKADGTRFTTGVYSASFMLQSQDSSLVKNTDNTSLAKLIAKENKVKFEQYWVSLDETYGYHTGSITISRINRKSGDFISNDPVINAINLEQEYRKEDEVKVRVFGRDIQNENDAPVKVPYSRKSVVFDKVYYRVKDADSNKVVVDFGENDSSTRLSTDSDGMFFDFHMDILPVGRTYTFEYLIVDRNVRKIVGDRNAAFRVK